MMPRRSPARSPTRRRRRTAPFLYQLPADVFADIDAGDSLSYAATLADGSALPGWLSFDVTTRSFSGTPGNGDVGSVTVRVTATDGAGASVSDDFVLAVANTNDAPTLATPLADVHATEDSPFSFTVPPGAFADPDAGDSLSYARRLRTARRCPAG
jgi:large repetitive protein